MAKLFGLEAEGYFYSRLQNPTCDSVAAKIAELEGGTSALLTSSGQAANFYAVFNIASSGDHVVASSAIYGGTYNLFAVTMKKMGVDFTFVSPDCTDEELEAAKRSVASDLRACLDSQGELEGFYLANTIEGLDFTPDELAALVEDVSREDVVEIAESVVLDAIYFLRGADDEEEGEDDEL